MCNFSAPNYHHQHRMRRAFLKTFLVDWSEKYSLAIFPGVQQWEIQLRKVTATSDKLFVKFPSHSLAEAPSFYLVFLLDWTKVFPTIIPLSAKQKWQIQLRKSPLHQIIYSSNFQAIGKPHQTSARSRERLQKFLSVESNTDLFLCQKPLSNPRSVLQTSRTSLSVHQLSVLPRANQPKADHEDHHQSEEEKSKISRTSPIGSGLSTRRRICTVG